MKPLDCPRISVVRSRKRPFPLRFPLLLLILFPLLPACGQEAPDAVENATAAPKRWLVYVIPIQGNIEPGLLHLVGRGVREAREEEADLLMLHMNTPGGRVDSAVEIKNLLLDARRDMQTATFADPEAISAGALLAISTQKIYMAEHGTIGDAAPITLMPGGGGTSEDETPEKIVAYVRGQFVSAAEIIGHSTEAARAMVDKDYAFPPYTNKGERKLLVLTAAGAVECGLAEAVADDLDQAILLAGFEGAEVRHVEETWSESIARFLTNPAVTGLLMLIGIIAIGIEFYTPGIGYPFAVGAVCFAILFWGHTVAGLAGYEVVLLFTLGVILLGIEMFVIPGFGVTGISGILLIFLSLVLAVSRQLPPTHELFDWTGYLDAVALVALSFLVGIIGLSIFVAALPRTAPFRRTMILSTDASETTIPELQHKAGMQGLADTDLRPAGIAFFGEERIQVISDGGFIPKGASIRILRTEGNRIIVEETD